MEKDLEKLKMWKKKGNTITRTINFRNFMEGLKFINEISAEAEKMDHHPDVTLKYHEVTFVLTTHDKKAITEKDVELAKKIDKILGE